MYLIAIASQIFAAGMFFFVWLCTDWTPWTSLVIALPIIAVFSLLALPFARALWVAIDYLTDVATGEAETPRYDRSAFERDPQIDTPVGPEDAPEVNR